MQFVVLSSSSGTTFQAVLDRIADGSLTARCLGLVTDRADRRCTEKARKVGLPVQVVERRKGETREEYDRRLEKAVLSLTSNNACHIELVEMRTRVGHVSRATSFDKLRMTPAHLIIACIGWMYLLSPWFVKKWKPHIINVHPSLLPKYPGTHPHEEVLQAGERASGMTIHWVDEGIDTGPIIVQKKCSVLPGDTVQTLKTRVQELEKEWYPKVLQWLQERELTMLDEEFPLPSRGENAILPYVDHSHLYYHLPPQLPNRPRCL